jgi:hypothetical protein
MGYDDNGGSGGPSGLATPTGAVGAGGLRYFGDASEDVGEPGLGIDIVEARVRRLAHNIDAEGFRHLIRRVLGRPTF